jgi:hypothetical protein
MRTSPWQPFDEEIAPALTDYIPNWPCNRRAEESIDVDVPNWQRSRTFD